LIAIISANKPAFQSCSITVLGPFMSNAKYLLPA
jgi:hypothetical protein